MAQLLRFLSTDLSSGRRLLPLDHTLAHHLHQCSYHLRLFRNWLVSGQDPLECLHGQPLAPPSIPQPHAQINHCSRFSWDCACSVVDSHALPPDVSACLPVSVVMQTASCSGVSCLGLLIKFKEVVPQLCHTSFPILWIRHFLSSFSCKITDDVTAVSKNLKYKLFNMTGKRYNIKLSSFINIFKLKVLKIKRFKFSAQTRLLKIRYSNCRIYKLSLYHSFSSDLFIRFFFFFG